ncbi:hypothetical protein FSP39_001212 [Pinctada imbricata]|uniref:Cytochrome P450 n=1 Tax=Pinctada imbricata TaxID=66713 RepID=A0AA88Y1N7_PINIB|nr:hypothetical protein FSP39_001212 [Pinctada imbricata]
MLGRRHCLRLSDAINSALLTQRFSATSAQTEEIRHVKPYDEIPGPTGLTQIPHIGIAFHLKPFTNFQKYRMNDLFASLRDKYGPVFKMHFNGVETVFVCDADDIEKVCKADESNPYRAPIALIETYCKREGEPKGLGVLNGEEWGAMRRPAQYNMLRPQNVQRYFPLVNDVADDFIEKLARKPYVPDIRKELIGFAVENAAYLAFNRRIGCLDFEENEFVKQYSIFFESIMESFFIPPTFRIYRSKFYRKYKGSADFIYRFVESEVKKAKEELIKAQEKEDFDPDKDPHLIYQLLSDKRMSPDSVKAILVDIINAGGESTASSSMFLLHHLASNKEVQNRLYEEINKNLPTDGILTDAALKQMSYLKACLKESFRCVYPLPLGTERTLQEDIVLSGYLIPKNTKMGLCMNTILAKNPDLFTDPNAFRPERWMRDSLNRSKHSFATLPFGFGARSCIGQRFAEQEIHVLIAKVKLLPLKEK